MQRFAMPILVFALTALIPTGATSQNVLNTKLTVEQQTFVKVGELAVLQIPSDRHYSITTDGDALVTVRRSKNQVLYRAVRPGQQTVVLKPEVPSGECISCSTLHYFVTVLSRK
jgi:hypothetical protein